jgi:predicted secreted protein
MWPDHDRVNVDKHGDWVEMFEGDKGWEITYRGKKPMEQKQVEDFLRRRDHSIEVAMKVWLNDPKTILVYEGQHLAERHLADQVTLISPENEAVTILTDADSHLPLRRSFKFRDPEYHDFVTDAEEYDDYHDMGGLPTPLRISRFRNEEMVRQFYIDRVTYNQDLGAGFWDVDALARHIKR